MHSDPDSWRRSLSNQQWNAIRDYTDGSDKEINAALRAGLVDERAAHIESALRTFGHDEMVVYRGLSARYVGGPGAAIGSEFTDLAFASSSREADIAWDFAEQARRTGDVPVILRVAVPKGSHGAPVESISARPGEAEFLLRPGQTFEVMGYDVYRGFRVLNVRLR
ncbi:MAG: hypothetical protein HGB10_07300 [Coriobacteriia bacterium]|nr:hypothetical protein [Coriobacteriia bacterium]